MRRIRVLPAVTWIYVACMEGAVQSGILAARAISGRPFPIVNDWFQVTRGPLHGSRKG